MAMSWWLTVGAAGALLAKSNGPDWKFAARALMPKSARGLLTASDFPVPVLSFLSFRVV